MRRSAQLVATRMRSSCIHTQDFMRRGGGLSALTTRIRSAEMAPGCSTCWRGFAAAHRSLLDLLDLPPSTPRDEVRKKYLDAVLRTHPDILRTDDPEAHQQLIALNNAWEGYRRLKWRGAPAPLVGLPARMWTPLPLHARSAVSMPHLLSTCSLWVDYL